MEESVEESPSVNDREIQVKDKSEESSSSHVLHKRRLNRGLPNNIVASEYFSPVLPFSDSKMNIKHETDNVAAKYVSPVLSHTDCIIISKTEIVKSLPSLGVYKRRLNRGVSDAKNQVVKTNCETKLDFTLEKCISSVDKIKFEKEAIALNDALSKDCKNANCFSTFVNYMQSNFDEEQSSNELIDQNGTSKPYFETKYDTTVNKYLNSVVKEEKVDKDTATHNRAHEEDNKNANDFYVHVNYTQSNFGGKQSLSELIAKMSTRVKLPENTVNDVKYDDLASDASSCSSSDDENSSSIVDLQNNVSVEVSHLAINDKLDSKKDNSLIEDSSSIASLDTTCASANIQKLSESDCVDLGNVNISSPKSKSTQCIVLGKKDKCLSTNVVNLHQDSNLEDIEIFTGIATEYDIELPEPDSSQNTLGIGYACISDEANSLCQASECFSVNTSFVENNRSQDLYVTNKQNIFHKEYDEIDGITFYSFATQEELEEFSKADTSRFISATLKTKQTFEKNRCTIFKKPSYLLTHVLNEHSPDRSLAERNNILNNILTNNNATLSSNSDIEIPQKILTEVGNNVEPNNAAVIKPYVRKNPKLPVSFDEVLLSKGKIYGRRFDGRFARKTMVMRCKKRSGVQSNFTFSSYTSHLANSRTVVSGNRVLEVTDFFRPVAISRSMTSKTVKALVSWTPRKRECNYPGGVFS